ncbi:MAG: DUF6884 domain-containing protein [Ktedonobacterales bacterium]
MRRLLLLACSKRKRPDFGKIPAIERYDGPAFRMLRKFANAHPEGTPEVYVLSARYGLIPGDTPISAYECQMTSGRARELQAQVEADVAALDMSRRYRQVFILAGAVYRHAIPLNHVPPQRLTVATGSPGVRLAQLKSWLHQSPSATPVPERAALDANTPVRLRLRGNDYGIAPSTAIAVARQAVRNGAAEAMKNGAWYVLVDGYTIAPKRLVSQLTCLPVGSFHSDDARRVLRCLGLSVRQT